MRFIRYQTKNQPPAFGWVQDDQVGALEGSPLTEFRRLPAHLPLESVRLLPPILPSKIICVGRNYVEHAREHGNEVPDVPLIFLKPPTSIIGPGAAILLPPQSERVEHEGELVIVIGRGGRHIEPADAADYVLGYTIGNDVTARDLQRRDNQWTRAKGFDTFCPFGPWIDTEFDPSDAIITCKVNGQPRQMASTRDMVFSVNQIIAYISSVMTLEPGDILFTGTPSGVGPLKDGDRVEAEIEDLGVLVATVKAKA